MAAGERVGGPGDEAVHPDPVLVCYSADQGFGLDRVLASLPREAEDLLRSWPRTFELIPQRVDPDLDLWCSDVTTGEARTLAAIIEDAQLAHRDMFFSPVYVSDVLGSTQGVSIEFWAQLPDEVA